VQSFQPTTFEARIARRDWALVGSATQLSACALPRFALTLGGKQRLATGSREDEVGDSRQMAQPDVLHDSTVAPRPISSRGYLVAGN
jgi:hypothetical protein